MLPALLAAARIIAPTMLRAGATAAAEGATASEAFAAGSRALSNQQLGQAAKAGYNAYQANKKAQNTTPAPSTQMPEAGGSTYSGPGPAGFRP